MAKTNVPDDTFIREVDEAYNRDRLASAWTRYGRWLILVAILSLVALGGWLLWRDREAGARGAAGEQLAAALDTLESNPAAAGPPFEALGQRSDIYAAMAQIAQGGAAAAAGDVATARKLYDAVAEDASQPQPVRDLALVKSIRLKFDALKPAEVIERLRPLAIPGSPWFAVAGELTGLAYLKNGQPTLAAPIFASIARDDQAPPSLRVRAEQLAGSLGVTPVGAAPVLASGAAPEAGR